jgi:hypothetical protein
MLSTAPSRGMKMGNRFGADSTIDALAGGHQVQAKGKSV